MYLNVESGLKKIERQDSCQKGFYVRRETLIHLENCFIKSIFPMRADRIAQATKSTQMT